MLRKPLKLNARREISRNMVQAMIKKRKMQESEMKADVKKARERGINSRMEKTMKPQTLGGASISHKAHSNTAETGNSVRSGIYIRSSSASYEMYSKVGFDQNHKQFIISRHQMRHAYIVFPCSCLLFFGVEKSEQIPIPKCCCYNSR